MHHTLKIFLALLILAVACKKKEEQPQVQQPVTYPDYGMLKTGNYWIYNEYRLTDSVEVNEQIFDSVYVEKDTMINGQTFYKLVDLNTLEGTPYTFLRDSLSCIVNDQGRIVFSSADFTSNLGSFYFAVMSNTDTVCKVTMKMTDKDQAVNTPAGVFITSSYLYTYSFYPHWQQSGAVRTRHIRYAKGVGMVMEDLPFYVALTDTWQRRLVRYHVH